MKSREGIARDALGVGLRAPHYDYVARERPAIDYFELLSDNYFTVGAPPRRRALALRQHYPIALHGVGLNLLGHEPLDEQYIGELCQLASDLDAVFVSDHLCWTASQSLKHHDLLPTPFTEAIVDYAVERAAYVQRRLGRPFALENLSSYVEFEESTMPEWDFYTKVVQGSGVRFMLDLNNVYVSSVNHGFDPMRYLDAIDFSRVEQVHLAGYQTRPDGLIVDTHDHPVSDPVWELYARAWQQGGPFPTLLEWDAELPSFESLLGELEKARAVRS